MTDTYPQADSKRTLILYRPEDNARVDIGRFYSPPEIAGEIRCDLHPRWNRDGTQVRRDGAQVCFDSVHEGGRQMYVVDVRPVLVAAPVNVLPDCKYADTVTFCMSVE